MSSFRETPLSHFNDLLAKEHMGKVHFKIRPRKAKYLDCVSDDEDNGRQPPQRCIILLKASTKEENPADKAILF
jgi:hypothetical protein